MLRAKVFAFALACIMVAPQADAQGNRGNSNGVPGQISNIQAIIDAVLAQIAMLPDPTELQEQLAELQSELGTLRDTLETATGEIATLVSRVAALEAAGGGGGAASPIIWSGGCAHRGDLPPFPGYVTYCADGLDFSSMGGRLTIDPTGVIEVNEPGFYRINYWGVGRTTTSRVRLATGTGVISEGTDTTGGGFYFRDLSADATWTFQAGNVFAVQVSTEGGAGNFAYDAWTPFGSATAAQSRLQIEYVGPLPE